MKSEKEEKELMIVKSNSLIQQTKFSLTLQQHRIVQVLISLVSFNDTDFNEYTFNVKDFCEMCGIDSKNGKNYINLKNAIKSLSDKSAWIVMDGEERLLRWIEKPSINTKTGQIKIKLDPDLKPYLLQLSRDFTQYPFKNTMFFHSAYSFRLYDLLESVHYHDCESYDYRISIGELKDRMDASSYGDWFNFRVRVLEPAVNEINQYTYKKIRYEAKKEKGRAIDTIVFHIETKPVEERVRLAYELFREPRTLDILKALDDTSTSP